jgi:hypothetical protein
MEQVMNDTRDMALEFAENCGYAIATMEAFMAEPGVSPQQVKEAIRRLQESSAALSDFLNTLSNVEESK